MKQWTLQRMSRKDADEISSWIYDPPYERYSFEPTAETYETLLGGSYFSIRHVDGSLIGFCCLGREAQVPGGLKSNVYSEPAVDIGLGLNPSLTGKKLGAPFTAYVVHWARNAIDCRMLRLSVADFNVRARKTYEKVGFKKHQEFTNRGTLFYTMLLPASAIKDKNRLEAKVD
ncbi:GNAT family N-acetyltransferase [Bacillus daqingensis]|uniref:GNAT family N-acetyltransferase n=1 Tax=Bacillus daqingensis TaxID=872396 RepID=A0ABV9NUC2_9BACI